MLITGLGIGLSLLTMPLALALGVLCAELLAGLLVRAGSNEPPAGADPRVVIIMPAHDEAKVIGQTVTTTLDRTPPGMELLVIADNCSDDTAALARAAGARVAERCDPARRGKGFALAHGLAVLATDPPDAVIILDADSIPEPDALRRLSRTALATGRPVQSCYLLSPGPGSGPITRISNFAFMLKNLVRQNGMAALGGTCMLTGSGMAFPWRKIAGLNLANGEIVEDLVLGLRLTLAGDYPLFDADACIISTPAPSDADTTGQRRRWEHGFLGAAARFVPLLVRGALAQRRREPLWTALHMLVPPFVLLLTVSCLWWALLLAAWLADLAPAVPLVSLGLLIAAAAGLIVAAWSRFGRSYCSVADLLGLPRYVASKIGIWTGLVTSRQSSWNRTER